jgi:hypothetical protein
VFNRKVKHFDDDQSGSDARAQVHRDSYWLVVLAPHPKCNRGKHREGDDDDRGVTRAVKACARWIHGGAIKEETDYDRDAD